MADNLSSKIHVALEFLDSTGYYHKHDIHGDLQSYEDCQVTIELILLLKKIHFELENA